LQSFIPADNIGGHPDLKFTCQFEIRYGLAFYVLKQGQKDWLPDGEWEITPTIW
jgi:hypothetical protein